MFALLDYKRLPYRFPNKLDSNTQLVMGYQLLCAAFSIYLIGSWESQFEVGQKKVFRLLSVTKTSGEKYLKFRKSLTHFGVLIADEHSGQFS